MVISAWPWCIYPYNLIQDIFIQSKVIDIFPKFKMPAWKCMAVMHLPIKFGADIFIQSGVIDSFRKLKIASAAILDLFG